MAWPWRFVDIDDQGKALRRVAIDRYAAYSQLSVLLPILAFVGIQAATRVYRWVSNTAGGSAYSSIPTVPDSPSLKSRHRTLWGRLSIRIGAVRWWLGDELVIWGKSCGSRDVWVFGSLWTAWLLLLCALGTGEDYLHLTKRFGAVAAAQMPVQYLLALKFLNPFAFAFRVSHEQMNKWHRAQGRVIYLLLLLHAICYLNFFIQVGILVRRLFAPVVFAGVVSWVGINLMTATAVDVVRNMSYRLFFIVHLFVSFTLPPLLFYHAKPARASMASAAAFIVLDIVVRRLRTMTSNAALQQIPGTNLIKISAALPRQSRVDEFRDHAGSHAYISIPETIRSDARPDSTPSLIYEFCMNPFTVAEVDDKTGDLTFVVRHRNGPTTAALARLAVQADAQGDLEEARVPLSIEGPYGVAKHFPNFAGPDFDRILMVAGGVGATFIVPLYRAIVNEKPLAKIQLVWVLRGTGDASWAGILADEKVQIFLTGDEATMGGPSTSPPQSPQGIEMGTLRDDAGRGAAASYHRGRPDLRKIVDDTFRHGSEERIAVLVCGPEEMARDLRRHVGAWVQKGRSIWWHNEAFGW